MFYFNFYILAEGLNSPVYMHPPSYMAIPHFDFFPNPLLLAILPWQYRHHEILNNHKLNSYGKAISLYLEDSKTMLHAFFISNTFIINNIAIFGQK